MPDAPEKENAYQSLRPVAHAYMNRQASPQRYKKMINDLGMEKAEELLTNFVKLRFARLLAYLRQQEPNAMIGYSILIYDLTQDEINTALYGPAEHLMF